MLFQIVHALQDLLPLEVAITFGLVLFAVSWIWPRRIISLPYTGQRTATLVWVGVAGSLAVIAVATAVSALAATVYDYSGYDGWWRRPAPLLAATVVVAVAAIALRQVPLPAPGERAIAPRRQWHAFVSRTLLWISGITAALLALTSGWQIAIATTAPEDGPFFGHVPEHTDLPIYMRFNSGYGYLAGAGWPNHLATLVALGLAGAVLVVVLRADANRPLFARATAVSVRSERELTARLLTFILLGGLITTLGAVWMHTGSAGTAMVGLDEEWVSDTQSFPQIHIAGGYDVIARPMNLLGYALQAVGVAFLLRIAVDTVRAARAARRSDRDPIDRADSAVWSDR
jgi:TRAP-type C4-dicarboxylate transport system permease small subunit